MFSLAATIVTLATGAPPGADEAQLRVVGRGLRRALSIDPAKRPLACELLAEIVAVPTNRVDVAPAIGRAEESAAFARALTTHRVVTATGIGGIGKSHLVAAVADRLRPRFPGGVWFARLEAGKRADLAGAFAQVLGVQAGSIADRLGLNAALLVLDLAEQPPSDLAPAVQALVNDAPALTVLAANRDPIGLSTEAVVPLGPLAEADAEALASSWGLPRGAAASGVPLAIRMNASGSVADAVAAGVAGLDAESQAALGQLTIFSHPFTRAAAWAVARVRGIVLDQLVARGLVARVGERYRLLDLVAAHVRPDAEDPKLRRRLQHWTRRRHSEPPDPIDVDEALAVAVAAVEVADDAFLGANLQVLIDRLCGLNRLPAAYDLAGRVVERFSDGAEVKRRAQLFRARFGTPEATEELASEAERIGDHLLHWFCRSALAQWRRAGASDPSTAQTQRDAAAVFRDAGEDYLLAITLVALANDLIDRREFDAAIAAAEESVAALRILDLPWTRAAVLDVLGTACLRKGDNDAARAALEQSIALLTAAGDRRGAAWSLASLAALELQAGNRVRGLTMTESAVADLAAAGDSELCGSVMTALGAALADEDPARALLLIETGMALAPDLFSQGLVSEGERIVARCREAVGAKEARRIADLAKSLDLPTAAELALAP